MGVTQVWVQNGVKSATETEGGHDRLSTPSSEFSGLLVAPTLSAQHSPSPTQYALN